MARPDDSPTDEALATAQAPSPELPHAANSEEPKISLFAPATFLAAAGLFLSLLLELVHVQTYLRPQADSFCAVGETLDCTVIAASASSVFLGLPWALWGAAGFIALLTASLKRSIWLLPLSAIAACASLALLGVSLFKIGTLCSLCEGVHLVSIALFVVVYLARGSLHGQWKDFGAITTIFAAPAGIILALYVLLPTYWSAFTYKAEPPFATGVTADGHPWIGAKSPSVTIEEFTDYNCPHCKAASTRTLRRLGEHPGWRVVRRQQPRTKCSAKIASTCQPARLASCAQEQGKFWRADRWLFTHNDPRKKPNIKRMIHDLDLRADEFQACFVRPSTFEKLDAEAKFARKQKIVEVPGYRIDGKRYRAHEFEAFVKSTRK